MSFIITLYVREGIVIASDSRLTLNTTQQQQNQTTVNLSVGQSDFNYKTFLTPNNVGISTYGAADIAGVPIAGYIESFINEQLSQNNVEVDDIPQRLLSYFQNLGAPNTEFVVAGYKSQNNQFIQQVWHVSIGSGTINQVNPSDQQGTFWGGEGDILIRLIKPLWDQDSNGNYQQLPTYHIPWGFFTLQDAIDFAVYAVRTTADSIRFQPRPKTVGGPIDVLVIKPDTAFWVDRKVLRV